MTSTEAFSMDALLGSKLLTKAGGPKKATSEVMKGKDLLLLYFSASWCPPCKAFSPILVNFYNSCAKQGKLEIVYVSSDRTVPDFEGYFKVSPLMGMVRSCHEITFIILLLF
jgi:nucleoredoxin